MRNPCDPEEPLLGIRIDIDIAVLHELVAKLRVDMRQEKDALPPHGLEPSPMNDDMLEATIRLIKCMRDPMDGRVLGIRANALHRETVAGHSFWARSRWWLDEESLTP